MNVPLVISRAGTVGGSFQSYQFAKAGKYIITGRYEHFEIPDTTKIQLNGQTIFSSGTLSSGGLSFAESFELKEGETATLSFLVDAPFLGTAWNYSATVTSIDPKPPVARNDSERPGASDTEVGVGFRVTDDEPLTIAPLDLLANDSDPDNDIDPDSFTIVGQPKHGTLTYVSGTVQVLTYTPDFEALKEAGRDSFTYTVADKGGRVSNVATVFIEGPCSPPFPYTISGGTMQDLGNGSCRTFGNFYIGRADGEGRLVFVQNGVAEYNKDKLEILSGTFSSAVGPEPIALFTLTQKITFFRNSTGAVELISPIQGDVALGGVPFQITNIALDKTEIDLGGNLILPTPIGGQEVMFGGFNSVGGAPFGAKVTALSIGPEGVSVESGEVTLKDIRYNAFGLVEVKSEGVKFTLADNLDSALPDLTVNGKLSITTELFNSEEGSDPYGFFFDLLPPDNGIKIAGGKLDDGRGKLGTVGELKTESGWGIENVFGDVQFTDGSFSGFEVGGTISFPEIPVLKGGIDGIEGKLGFVTRNEEFYLDDLRVKIRGEIPIGATGWFLTALGGGFENIQPNKIGSEGFNRPLIYSGILGIGFGPSETIELDEIIPTAGDTELRVFSLDMDGELRKERSDEGAARKGDFSITASATASFLAPELLEAKAKASINFTQGLAEISNATMTAFGGIFVGSGTLSASIATGQVTASLGGDLKVPDLPIFFSYRGQTLDSSRLEAYAIGDTFAIQAWKPVVLPGIGATDIGVRYDSTKGVSFITGTKPALKTNSWQMQGSEDWLQMAASWDNAAGRDVALRVTYQAVAGGPILETYEEADFAAAGILASLDFSGDFSRSVFVNDPRAGVWDVEVVDATGLGAVTYDGFIPTARPEIELLDATVLAGAAGAPTYEISYEAFDPDSTAEIVFFIDNDGAGYNGTPIGAAGLVTETDGAGKVTFSTADFPAGAKFIYAMIMDGDSAPVFSNYIGPLQGRAETDLALQANGPGPEVETGGWAGYSFTIENLGPGTAIDGVLELKFSELTFLPKGSAPVDPRDGRFFDTMNWRLLGQNDGLTPLGWSRLDTYTTASNGEVVATPNGDWVFKVAVEPLAAGTLRTLDIQFQAPASADQALSVEATVSSAGWETDVSNDSASLFTNLITRRTPTADLSVTRIAPNYGADPVPLNDYEYAYVITNNSLEAAEGVTLTVQLGPEIPLPSFLESFQRVPATLVASTAGFEPTDESAPWTTQQQNYLYTITFNNRLEGGESVVVPIRFRPNYDWVFDDIATVSHAGQDTNAANDVVTGVLDLPVPKQQPAPPPVASVRIEADDYTPSVGEVIKVTARFGADQDVGGQLFRVSLPSGVELVSSRTLITVGTIITDRPVSNEVTFTPDPENPGTYLWQLADVFASGDRSLEMTLRVLDASPQPISIEMVASPRTFANATVGNGLIGESDDASLILNDPAGPPPPPPFIGLPTRPFVDLQGYIFDNPLPDIVEGQFFSYTFGAEAFEPYEPGEALAIALTSGPSWLNFDPATLTISGTPDAPTIFGDFTLSATDPDGDAGVDTVRLRVINTPDAPVIARQIADQTVKVGTSFVLRTPNPQNVGLNGNVNTIGVFSDPDFLDRDARTLVGNDFVEGRDYLSLSFSGLPDWLALDDSDPQMPMLRGLAFADDLGTSTISITATDIFGLSTTMTFDVEVVANDNPINGFTVSAGSGIVTEGNSGTTLARISIVRVGDASGPASVAWEVVGTGEAPVDARDFDGRLPSGLAEFASGETVKIIELRVRGDLLPEGDESFQVVLSDAVGAPIALDNARMRILNDDGEPQLGGAQDVATSVGFQPFSLSSPFPYFGDFFLEGDEGITYAVVKFLREGNLSGTTTVTWRLEHVQTDASDFGGTNPRGTAVFQPGQSMAEVRIPISGDSVIETLGQNYIYFPEFGEDGAYFLEGQSPDDLEFQPDIQFFYPFETPFLVFDEEFYLQIESVEGAVIGQGQFRGIIYNDDPMFSQDAFDVDIRRINPVASALGGAEGTTFSFELTTQDFGAFTPDNTIAWEIVGVGDAPADAADFAPATLASGVAEFGVGNTSRTISVNVAADGIGENVEQFALVLRPFDPASTLRTKTGAAIATILNGEYGLRDDAASTPVGEAVEIDLLGNDIAPPGGSLTMTRLGAPTNGSVTFGETGKAIYTPNPGFSGTDSFTYTTRGADGAIRTASVTVTVAASIEIVDAQDDTASTQPGTTIEVNVLSNDTGPGSAPLSVVHFGYASSGEVEITAEGLLRYTPNTGFSGLDVIRYSAGDGLTEDSALLTIAVGNRAPAIELDVREPSVGDRRPEAAIRVADILIGDDGIGEHNFTLSGPDAAMFELRGEVLYLRAGVAFEGKAGEALSVNVHVDDALLPGGPEDVASFTLEIVPATNATPFANSDFFRGQASGRQIFDLIANDRDFDGDTISLVSVAGATKGSTEIVDGKLAYTPFQGVTGEDSFAYEISDGRSVSVGQARIRLLTSVVEINNPPVANDDPGFTTPFNTQLSIPLTELIANDTDDDPAIVQVLTVTAVSDAINGTAQIVGSDVVFTPNAGYFGSASFSYTISDGAGGFDAARVDLTVGGPVNQAPVLAVPVADQTIAEDSGAWTFAVPAGTFTDVDNATLTLSASGLPGWLSFDAATRTFTGTPPSNFNGTVSLTVTATDAGGLAATDTFDLVVTAVNDAPVLAVPVADQTIAEDSGAWTFAVPAGTFTDVDNATLTLSASGLPGWLSFDAATRTFTGTPPSNFNGTVSLTVTATDAGGLAVTDTFDLVVTAVNDAPVLAVPVADQTIAEDSGAWTFAVPAGTFTDVDNATLTLSASGLPGWLSFDAATRTFTGTPPSNFNGTVSLTVTATDAGGLAVTDTFDLVVTAVNDAPVLAVPVADQTIAEDSGAWTFAVPAGTFTDVDNATLTLSASGLPGWLSFDAATRTFTGTPPSNFNGTVSLTVTATDAGGLAVTDTFDLVVTAVNDAPVLAVPVADQTIAEDSGAWTFAVPAGTFTDVDNATLTLSASGLPGWLSFDAATRTFTGTPPSNFNGTVSLTVTATDAGGLAVTDTFDLVVTAVNDNASISGLLTGSVTEDILPGTTGGMLTVSDPDGGEDAFRTPASLNGAFGAFTFNSVTGAWSYVLDNSRTATQALLTGQVVHDTLTVISLDGTASQTINITVNGNDEPSVNTRPVANNDVLANPLRYNGGPQVILRSSLLGNDTDAEGSPLTITSVGSAVGGTVSLNSSGNVVFTPAASFQGPASFTYNATDGTAASNAATVSFFVGILGTNNRDTLFGTASQDYLFGLGSNDLIIARGSSDVINGGAGDDIALGGSGNDRFIASVDDGNDLYFGYLGIETYDFSATSASANVDLHAETASSAQTGSDRLVRIENLVAGSGDDTLRGSDADNQIDGGAGNDVIEGRNGRDWLNGGAGNDKLIGGVGADWLDGGSGVDYFVFNSAGEIGSSAASRDIIYNFNVAEDVIDLHGIDANRHVRSPGDQAFSFLNAAGAPITGIAQLHFVHTTIGGKWVTLVEGNVNNDLAPEFTLELHGGHYSLSAMNFWL